MFKNFLLIFTLFLIFLNGALAQESTVYHPCGIQGEDREILQERFLRNKASFLESPAVQERDVTYVPITFLLVARTNGTGRVSEAAVLDQVCSLNEDFLDMNVQFYIKQFKYINNNSIYDNPGGGTAFMTAFRDPSSINFWITANATSSNAPQPPGTITLGYYDPTSSRDWVVCIVDVINGTNSTAAHEIGHFFSLIHPHNGWETDPWQPGDPNPVGLFSPGGVLTEKQNGSNCENAGDFVCDTPPDYNGVFWDDCDFSGALDPDGTAIDPDESNFMSYFSNCPPDAYHFSEMQKALMIQNLNSAARNYVRPGITPSLAEINGTTELVSPADGAFVEGFNAVNLQWTAVPGADRYLLEIDENTDFAGIGYRTYVVFGPSKVIDDLEANETYYWRVTPFSQYRTCAPASERSNFNTGSLVSTSAIRAINSWSVDPNPASAGGELSLRLQASDSFEGQLSLYSLSGRLVRDGDIRRVETGNNRLGLPLHGLEAGVYLLSLRSGNQQLTTRVVVTN